MSFPTIPEEDAESRWVKADSSIVVAHLQDLMPFCKRELDYISSKVLEQQLIRPDVFTHENDGWVSKAGNFCLDYAATISLIDFLQKAVKKQDKLVIGTTMFYDEEEGEHVNRLVVCSKSFVGTHVEMKLVEKIKRDIKLMRDNLKKDELRRAEREAKKSKLAELIGKFLNKEITFEEFQSESAKLK